MPRFLRLLGGGVLGEPLGDLFAEPFGKPFGKPVLALLGLPFWRIIGWSSDGQGLSDGPVWSRIEEPPRVGLREHDLASSLHETSGGEADGPDLVV